MGDICQGLTAAHNADVIHRDLKPSNLLVALRGREHDAYAASRRLPASLANAKVKITDFGIAKAVADSRLTLTNAFSGTPGYMAPEQFRGEKPSPETDVYALGVLTCELLTGKPPSQPMRTIPSAHPAVTEVVVKAMSPVRANRFPTAAAFYEALCNAIEGRSPIRRTLQPARTAARTRQILAVALIAGVVGLAMTLAILRNPPRRQVLSISPFENDNPVAIEWHSPPRVSELPPIVEEARGRLPATGLTGPLNPKIKWSVTLPTTSARIIAVGRDGTVYVRGMDELLAIRNGKLVWGYKIGYMGSGVQLDDDGRVPEGFHEPAEHYGLYHCIMNQTFEGPAWKRDLDGSCTAGPVTSSDGARVSIATDLPQILTTDQRGKTEFEFTPSCTPNILIPTLRHQLLYACENRTLHGLDGPVERWTRTADGTPDRDMLADASGMVYFGDWGRTTAITHLHAIDPLGTIRWTIDLKGAGVGNMALGGGGQLYLAGSRLHSKVMCLAD